MLKPVLKQALYAIESIVLLIALFDLFPLAINFMTLSIILLYFDLKINFLGEEKIEEIFKKYFSFPLLLLAFYIFFGSYSLNTLKLVALLAGYALIRVSNVYFKEVR